MRVLEKDGLEGKCIALHTEHTNVLYCHVVRWLLSSGQVDVPWEKGQLARNNGICTTICINRSIVCKKHFKLLVSVLIIYIIYGLFHSGTSGFECVM